MNHRLMFRPNLLDCILEERISPAIANFGVIVLTTNGYTLLTPFPGANSSGAATSVATSAAPVSGTAVPTSLYITGTGGISSLRPGNITGVPSLAGGANGAGGLSATIQVGSGADTSDGSGGGTTSAVVSRNTVADPTVPPLNTTIGIVSSGGGSPVLPPGQSYRDNAPVAPAPYGQTVPTPPPPSSGGMISDPFAPNPMSGAPTLGPSSTNNRGGLGGRMPGTLAPMGPM